MTKKRFGEFSKKNIPKRNYPYYGAIKKRKFNGRKYEWQKDYHKKTDAKKDAERLRKRGWNARITKERGMGDTKYAIYARRR